MRPYKLLTFLLHIPKKHLFATRIAVLAIAVVYPYICNLGGFPRMDEGSYAYMAAIYNFNLRHAQALAPLQGFALWPLLLAWIPDLPGLSIVWFRLADMLAALLAGWLLCKILEKECGAYSLVLALVVLVSLTSQHVIDNGFKNSFFPAWACFFGAICLIFREKTWLEQKTWILAGALTGFGILLRETFFPFAFLGLAAAWRMGSFKAALYYILGGIIMALLTLGMIELIAPGSLAAFYKGYSDRALVYYTQTHRMLPNFIKYLRRSILLFSPAFTLFITTGIWWALFKTPGKNSLNGTKIFFWLCFSLLPLYEPIIKISFYYHFAVCLPGLAFVAGLFAGQPQAGPRQAFLERKKAAASLAMLGGAAILASLHTLPNISNLSQTARVLAQFPQRDWPRALIPHSTTLQVVDKINKALPNGGSVSANGFAFHILTAGSFTPPLSGSFDRDDNFLLGDLGRFFLNVNCDKNRVEEALLANPPDIIVLMQPKSDHEPAFTPELRDVLNATGQYEKFATVDPDMPDNKATDQTWMSYDLYRHKPAADIPGEKHNQ